MLCFDAPSLVGKRFILFDPADWPSLYPFGCHHDLDRRSQLDLDDEAFNDAHFPNWKHARGKVVELSPGDCLYIPRHCWHYVRSLSPSFSVSFWWGARMALVDDADGVRSAY